MKKRIIFWDVVAIVIIALGIYSSTPHSVSRWSLSLSGSAA